MILTLPWPPKDLSPNARVHWSRLARAKKAYRAACAWSAKGQGAAKKDAQSLQVSLTFHPPTRRAIDIDNCLSRFKAGIDGLVDVLQVDDSLWRITIAKAEPAKGGKVVVEIAA
jgi:crossover junction endodeoxyribonuclease RusA